MKAIYSDSEVYYPVAVLGRGKFGKVLQCLRNSDGEMVALKVMTTGSHQQGLVLNELRLTAALGQTDVQRSHIVRFFESFLHCDQHYLVFEKLEMNLLEFLKEKGFRPLPVRHIRIIGCQLLRALVKLQEMSIIHGDMKPENIMIVDQARFPFRVKLIDFGSGTFFEDVCFAREPYIQSRFYRSPEILLGLPFCEKVDMWSLGCVMAELYLCWPLYPGESEFDQVRYICETQGPPSPHLLNRATKTGLFFTLEQSPCGKQVWQLRPTGQSTGPYGVQTYGKPCRTPERRKYDLRSLDQLYSVHGPEQDQAFGREDAGAEAVDRKWMVEFVKQALTIDSEYRITPSDALRHPFITLAHLQGSETSQHYYELLHQELQKALIPNGSNWTPTEDTQTPPPSYRDQSLTNDPPKLNIQEEASFGNQPIPSQSYCGEICCILEPVEAQWLYQVQYERQNMGHLSVADAEGQENTLAGWLGDMTNGPAQNDTTNKCMKKEN